MKEFRMFTNKSEVELIDHCGNDLTVVNAARVSFAKHSSELDQRDEKLINYLAKNQHFTPFTHVMFTFRIKMPVFVARQWFRHTVGLTRNEVSRRYVDDTPQYYLPDEIRARPDAWIKQGSGGVHKDTHDWRNEMTWLFETANGIYEAMINDDVAPEQARMVLPLAHMTEFYETASLAAYARVCKLRLDSHAQEEIRDVATLIDSLITPICPIAWGALMTN